MSFFVGLGMVMVTFFGTFPPLVEIRENPEFHDLMRTGQGGIGQGACSGMVAFWC